MRIDCKTNPGGELRELRIEVNRSAIVCIDGKIIAWEKTLSDGSWVDKPNTFDRILKRQKKPEWRNWQTRYVQGVVSITLMWVQIPPSAHDPMQIGFFIDNLCL